MSKMRKWEKLGDTVVLRCSRRGGALYLHLRSEIAEIHNLEPGDHVRVRLMEVSRKPKDQEGD